MRACFKLKTGTPVVIEVTQLIRFNEGTVGLILPYSKRFEAKKFDSYQTTEKVDERDYNNWCEQMMRTGYLDLSRTQYVFTSAIAV